MLLTNKCRVRWLQCGDRNSSFFHSTLRTKKINLGFDSLIIDGQMVTVMGRFRIMLFIITMLFLMRSPIQVIWMRLICWMWFL